MAGLNEVRAMRNAETILAVIAERDKKKT